MKLTSEHRGGALRRSGVSAEHAVGAASRAASRKRSGSARRTYRSHASPTSHCVRRGRHAGTVISRSGRCGSPRRAAARCGHNIRWRRPRRRSTRGSGRRLSVHPASFAAGSAFRAACGSVRDRQRGRLLGRTMVPSRETCIWRGRTRGRDERSDGAGRHVARHTDRAARAKCRSGPSHAVARPFCNGRVRRLRTNAIVFPLGGSAHGDRKSSAGRL